MSPTIPLEAPPSIRHFFEDLCVNHGLQLSKAGYQPDVFGNIDIVAGNDRFAIDYRRDRGDESLFIVVGDREYLMADAVELLTDKSSGLTELEAELAFARSNVNELRRKFSTEALAESIELLEAMRVRRLHRMFPGAVGGD